MSARHFGWFTTAPNPRSPDTGWDAGQRGWRLHAVPMDDSVDDPYKSIDITSALCGMWARHGWGVDLLIDTECARCQAAMTKREATGVTFIDLPAKRAAAHQAKLQAEAEAEYIAMKGGAT